MAPRALAKGFALYDLGAYPGMVPGDGVVHGEVYEIPEGLLRWLDWVEGAPFLLVEGAALIPSGEWEV